MRRIPRRWAILALGLAVACGRPTPAPTAGPTTVVTPERRAPPIPLPNKQGTLKFAVVGDFGTGLSESYSLAARMEAIRAGFPFELVLLVGDNLYGSERPQDYERKFAAPFKPLLDAKVKFYAALGNHDDRNQRFYQPFNMDGKLYYGFKAPAGNAKFLVLDSTYPNPEQLAWLQAELEKSNEAWKIAFFHHPLYSSGGRHGSDLPLRRSLEPLFLEHNVSVVFAGHDHFYERIRPQQGIVHFVVGSGGKLAVGDIMEGSGLTARGFDRDYAFLLCEIDGDQLVFNAVARNGDIVDSGIILRRGAGEPAR